MMYIRQVRRICSVRGCRNTECYSISRVREAGNTVIICKSCLGMALNVMDEINPETRSNIPKVDQNDIPPLFFNAKVKKTEAKENLPTTEEIKKALKDNPFDAAFEEAISKAKTKAKKEEKAEAKEAFICPECGKICASKIGLQSHVKTHEKKKEGKK